MPRAPRSLLALLPSALLFLAAPAAAEDFVIDPVHSSVVFKVGHAGASEFFGRFNQISGDLKFDEKDLKSAQVKATVKAASVDTNHKGRDDHLRGEEFLHVEAHPDIVFEASGFQKGREKDTYTVKGKLTLRGVTKDIEVVAKKIGVGEYPKGVKRIGFTCTFTIKRSDYAIPFPAGAVGDEVTLTIGIEATPQQEAKKE
jgi:polyisoprenoid-binding protein YceI